MNNMNNEYREALQRAKELHEAGNALTKAQMEIVFPELKQKSVREALKALVIECQGQYNSFAGVKLSDMIHYLENRKPEWSKEDQTMLENILADIEYCKRTHDSLVSGCYDMEKLWLEKLKKRASWKPTKEMMKALYEAGIRSRGTQYGIYLCELQQCLESL